jgi:regulator of sirC expression with transglutaminase-like and TPR domain
LFVLVNMQANPEIKALITLLDDPDAVVYDSVQAKLLSYGKAVLPNLESAWEQTLDATVQEKIEAIIHNLNVNEIKTALQIWLQKPNPLFIDGLLLMCGFRYKNIDEQKIAKKIKSIYQSIWLELNNYLTPVEQINIISNVLHNMYKLHQDTTSNNALNDFYINNLIENNQGNAYTIGAIYLQIAHLFDIPIYPVDIPGQFMLAYIDAVYDVRKNSDAPTEIVLFYIDPCNGMIYTKADIEKYLSKIPDVGNLNIEAKISNAQALKKYLEHLIICYGDALKNIKIVKELQEILDLL